MGLHGFGGGGPYRGSTSVDSVVGGWRDRGPKPTSPSRYIYRLREEEKPHTCMRPMTIRRTLSITIGPCFSFRQCSSQTRFDSGSGIRISAMSSVVTDHQHQDQNSHRDEENSPATSEAIALIPSIGQAGVAHGVLVHAQTPPHRDDQITPIPRIPLTQDSRERRIALPAHSSCPSLMRASALLGT